MKKSGFFFLIVVVGIAYGLTACGTSCSDACNKAVECNFLPVQWEGGCMNACENISDCGTKCSTGKDCGDWTACVINECLLNP